MAKPRKQSTRKREHLGADVMAYFTERAKNDPEFAAASLEEAEKLRRSKPAEVERASWSDADILTIARTLRPR